MKTALVRITTAACAAAAGVMLAVLPAPPDQRMTPGQVKGVMSPGLSPGVAFAQANLSSSAFSFTAGDTYTAPCLGVAAAATRDYCNLTNATGSGRVVRVFAITASVDSQTAITGLQPGWTVSRYTTAGSGCTAVTPAALDTDSPALPAEITANSNCSTDPTGLTNLFRCSMYADEVNAIGTVILYQFWNRGDRPIVLREGQGITLISGGTSPNGVLSVTIWFTVSTA